MSQARTNKAAEFRHAQANQSIAEASSASEEEAETETVLLPLIVQADVHVRPPDGFASMLQHVSVYASIYASIYGSMPL